MWDIVFEKAKGGRKVNRASVYAEGLFKKGVTRNFEEITRKHLKRNLFQVFFCEFCEFARTPFLQNSSGRLLLIIAVSVAKGVLANQTVNYETRTKAYVLI